MTESEPRRRAALRRLAPVLVVVAALLVVGIAAQGTGLQWDEAQLPGGATDELSLGPEFAPPSELPSFETPTALVDEGHTLPPWVSWLVLAIIIGIPAAIVLALVVRWLIGWLRDAPPAEGAEDAPEHVRRDFALVEAALESAIARMDLGEDPRSAIMACWVRLEEAAEAAGVERASSDTPADLVRHLLTSHDLDGAALNRLSEAYLLARYSPHEVGEADRDRARDALVALRGQLVEEAR